MASGGVENGQKTRERELVVLAMEGRTYLRCRIR